MNKIVLWALSFLFLLFLGGLQGYSQTLHVFVALCDNEHQGIVPVPARLGNGKDPANNLYWGAAYGVKSYFHHKAQDWILIETLEPPNSLILERVLFKHKTKEAYLLADAYDGEYIRTCTEDFLLAANGQKPERVVYKGGEQHFGGAADFLAYVGHDGLMEFDVDLTYQPMKGPSKDLAILACSSRDFFASEVEQSGANPLLWTTHLMAPEAYTLKAAIDGWLLKESGNQIRERAAQAYNKYQKCGIRGARNLFATGY